MSANHKHQEPHFDYKGKEWKNATRYWLGFLPITDYGQFLKLWDYNKDGKKTRKEKSFSYQKVG
jgi:hypothetical protein